MGTDEGKADHSLVTKTERSDLWRDGHLVLRSVASENEILLYRPIIAKALQRLTNEHRDLAERDTYGKAFIQVTNLWRQDDRVREFVFNRKFARIAADLLGVERVRLYHDQALFKEPGGGQTPWHQDMYYWPLATDRTVTMWMPLVDLSEEMGVMRFASGSHLGHHDTRVEISDESNKFYSQLIADKGFRIDGPKEMRAGDATFHLGWTIHSAGQNLTDRMREIMTVIYFADGTRILEPANRHQQADLEAFLGCRRPGEIADSGLNPVLN